MIALVLLLAHRWLPEDPHRVLVHLLILIMGDRLTQFHDSRPAVVTSSLDALYSKLIRSSFTPG